MGLEGIVSKRRGSFYRSGRSPDWIKSKNPPAPSAQPCSPLSFTAGCNLGRALIGAASRPVAQRDPMTAKSALIIVPVLNDEGSLAVLIQELARQLADRPQVSMLVVDDGSLPPVDIANLELHGGALPGQIITLTRNFGHQKAIAIGLAYAVAHRMADTVLVMDADGEDMPGDVPRLLTAAESYSELSVAVAKRIRRSERMTFRILYQLYRLLFLFLTGHRISFGNFAAMRIGAAQRLVNMSELWVSLPATILRSRLSIVELPIRRGRRYRDDSRMNLVSLVILGFGAIAAFLESAFTRIILAASGLISLCLVASAMATTFKLVGIATPGWVTTVVGTSLILMLGVAILSFVGLALCVLAGPHTIPTPGMLFQTFIARVAKFGPSIPPPACGSASADRRRS
jgi:glycosyltransferase involved in cell wall biosynthesis